MRKRKRIEHESDAPLPPFAVDPHTIYRLAFVQAALGLRESSLRTEWRKGRLKIRSCCGRAVVLGEDLLDWLRASDYPRRKCKKPRQQPRPRKHAHSNGHSVN